MNQINPRVPRTKSSGDDDSTPGGAAITGGRYGATELKAAYSRYLMYGLGASSGIFIVLALLYTIFVIPGKADPSKMKRAPVSTSLARIETPPPAEENTPPPPPPIVPENLRGSGGVAAYAGKPKAIPDVNLDPKLKDAFASVDNINVATKELGTGGGVEFNPDALNSKINLDGKQPAFKEKETDKMPDLDEFIDVSEEAQYDKSDLQRRIKYPPAAREQNIEGVVVVRALVDKMGHVSKVVIDRSDNKLLENAAVNAVKETAFTAAKQGTTPVATWVQVDVHFSLTN